MANPPDLHYHSRGSLVTVPKALAPDGQVILTTVLALACLLYAFSFPLLLLQVTFLLPDPSLDYIVSSVLAQLGREGITSAPSVPPASGPALTHEGSKDQGMTAVEEVRKLREEVEELKKEVKGLRKNMEILREDDGGGQEEFMSPIALLMEELKDVNFKLAKVEKMVEKDGYRNNEKVDESTVKTEDKTKEPIIKIDETFVVRDKTVERKKKIVKYETQGPRIEIQEPVANDEKAAVIWVKTDQNNNNKDDNVKDVKVIATPGNKKFEESAELETMEIFNFVSLKPKLVRKITEIVKIE